MLAKNKKLISAFLLSILTSTSITADGLKCSSTGCYVDVKKFDKSKNMPKKVSSFKNKKIVHKFLTPLEKSIQVKFKNSSDIEIISLEPYKYRKQENEILEPVSDEEMNTIVPAPEKFIASHEEQELYNEQQMELGGDIELIEPSLPMSLYYCNNNTEPIYDEKAEQFNCIISS